LQIQFRPFTPPHKILIAPLYGKTTIITEEEFDRTIKPIKIYKGDTIKQNVHKIGHNLSPNYFEALDETCISLLNF